MRYDWVLLDADGTLLDYDRAEAAALAATLTEVGASFVAEHLEAYRAINERLWAAFECGELTRDDLRCRRFEELSDRFSLGLHPEDFGRRSLGRLAQSAFLIDGARELLTWLRGRLGIVLLTNGFSEVQRPRLAAAGIASFFDHLVISGEVGAAKPAPEIFDVAFARMGNPKRERVMIVGDGLRSDIRGGNDYGIDTCWIHPAGVRAPADVRPTYEIRRLLDLIPLIGNPGSAAGTR